MSAKSLKGTKALYFFCLSKMGPGLRIVTVSYLTIGLSIPFNQFEAFSASSVLPLVINQTGDSGANKIPIKVRNGTTEQT